MRPKKIEIGNKIRWIKENRYVVSFLEDDGETLVVYKTWVPSRGWRYHCEYLKLFLYNICLQEDYDNTKREKLFELNGLIYGDW